MMILSSEETDELLSRDDFSLFPSLYALTAYERELNSGAYDQMVQAFYNV